MSFEDACTIPHASMLAYQGLITIGQLKKNQNVLINGAGGGVGMFALNIAKLLNATVTGVDSADKLKQMSAMGFDNVIDYKKADFTELNDRYDLILDTKLGGAPLPILKALNKNGQYVTVGGDLTRLLQTLLYKPFISIFTKKRFSILALKANINLDKIEDMYNNEIIKPIIDGPHSLQEVPEQLERFGKGLHQGKIIISIKH